MGFKMAEKKTETKKIERDYIIPLREKCRHVPRYKKTNKAVKTVREFLIRHMKIYDRDLNKIKIDRYLNEYLWFRGIRKPPYKIKVKAIKEGEVVKVELAEMPDKLKFKKAREEKREVKAKEALKKKPKSLIEKAKDTMQKPEDDKEISEDKNKDGVEDKKEEKEKEKAVVDAGQKFEKEMARKMKHQAKSKVKEPKRRFRQALQK